ncbi:MAG: hypothetical protein WHT63_06150, partial [Tepidiforma sp.]
MPRSPSSRAAARRALDRLRALRSDPEAAHAFARELLAAPADPETLLAAVDLLAAAPSPADLTPLRAAFAWLAAASKRRDPGTLLRARILDAIAPVATGEDLDLVRSRVEQALADFFAFDRMNFGAPVHFSDLVALLDGVRGVSHVRMYTPTQDVDIRAG